MKQSVETVIRDSFRTKIKRMCFCACLLVVTYWANAAPRAQFIAEVKACAEDGDANLQWYLGYHYRYGRGIQKDETEAVKWFRKAAEQGDVSALGGLFECYYHGIGVRQDHVQAVRIKRRMADRGSLESIRSLSQIYFTGDGVEKDEAEGFRLLRKSAEAGNYNAYWSLGRCYETGRGTARDKVAAYKWYYLSSFVDEEPTDNVEVALKTAALEREMTTDQVSDAKNAAFEFLATLFHQKAQRGDSFAQMHLSRYYSEGTGVVKDEKAALKCARAAAEGLPVWKYPVWAWVYCRLGDFYAEGRGTDQDRVEAYRWYYLPCILVNSLPMAREYARDAKDRISLIEPRMTTDEIARAKEEAEAFAATAYRKAVDDSYFMKAYHLAACYRDGKGVKKDPVQAYKWYFLAGNVPGSRAEVDRKLETIGEDLTGAEVAGAKRDAGLLILRILTNRIENGDCRAMVELGKCYYDGKLVPRDLVQAYKWHYMGAAYTLETETLFSVAAEMSPGQIAEAKRLAQAALRARAEHAGMGDDGGIGVAPGPKP